MPKIPALGRLRSTVSSSAFKSLGLILSTEKRKEKGEEKRGCSGGVVGLRNTEDMLIEQDMWTLFRSRYGKADCENVFSCGS